MEAVLIHDPASVAEIPRQVAPSDVLDQLVLARQEIARLQADHGNACRLVAEMHAAAVGLVRGPIVGIRRLRAHPRRSGNAGPSGVEGTRRLRAAAATAQRDLV